MALGDHLVRGQEKLSYQGMRECWVFNRAMIWLDKSSGLDGTILCYSSQSPLPLTGRRQVSRWYAGPDNALEDVGIRDPRFVENEPPLQVYAASDVLAAARAKPDQADAPVVIHLVGAKNNQTGPMRVTFDPQRFFGGRPARRSAPRSTARSRRRPPCFTRNRSGSMPRRSSRRKCSMHAVWQARRSQNDLPLRSESDAMVAMTSIILPPQNRYLGACLASWWSEMYRGPYRTMADVENHMRAIDFALECGIDIIADTRVWSGLQRRPRPERRAGRAVGASRTVREPASRARGPRHQLHLHAQSHRPRAPHAPAFSRSLHQSCPPGDGPGVRAMRHVDSSFTVNEWAALEGIKGTVCLGTKDNGWDFLHTCVVVRTPQSVVWGKLRFGATPTPGIPPVTELFNQKFVQPVDYRIGTEYAPIEQLLQANLLGRKRPAGQFDVGPLVGLPLDGSGIKVDPRRMRK